ncbi:MAG TPA: cytochrome c oxidase assembly protein [Nitriliruptorales bacterium]|nr:cytochrome c oxidase assembly protein [Nitriliruptorales bacterium]
MMVLAPAAHAGQPLAPHDLASAWSAEPTILLLLATVSVLYVRGARQLARSESGRRALPRWRVTCFAAAIVITAGALLSPLDALSETLFGAHMLQHLLLTLAVPPLLVLARPVLVVGMALGRSVRRSVTGLRAAVVSSPAGATGWAAAAVAAHTLTMWMWHLPVLYESAVQQPLLHVVEHTSMVAGAVPFWWLVTDARGRHANAAGVLAVFAGALQSAWLAGLLTFSGVAWYGVHAAGALAWGLTPLSDQQVAGGLMWFPGGLVYIIGGAAVFWRWLRRDQHVAVRRPLHDRI